MTITAAMVKELRQITDAPMMTCKNALQESNGDMDLAIEIIRKATGAKAAKRADKTAAEGKATALVDAHNKVGFIVEVNSETDFVARDASFMAFVDLVSKRGLENKVDSVEAALAIQDGASTIDVKRQELVAKIGENIQVRRVALLKSNGVVSAYCHGDRIAVLVALDKADAALAKDIAMHIAATNPTSITADDVPVELINKEKEIFAAQARESGKPDNIIEKMIDGRVAKFLKEISLLNQPFVKNPDQTVGDLLKEKSVRVTAFVRFEVGEGIEKVTQNFADEVMAQVQGK